LLSGYAKTNLRNDALVLAVPHPVTCLLPDNAQAWRKSYIRNKAGHIFRFHDLDTNPVDTRPNADGPKYHGKLFC
jgi:hypothetical protein